MNIKQPRHRLQSPVPSKPHIWHDPVRAFFGPEMVAKQNAIRQRKRDEMAELIAALDQRKRDMGVD